MAKRMTKILNYIFAAIALSGSIAASYNLGRALYAGNALWISAEIILTAVNIMLLFYWIEAIIRRK